jgi:hypothetical protein
MDWGDALFCFVAGLLAVAIVMVSRNLRRLAVAVEKLAERENSSPPTLSDAITDTRRLS